MPPRPGRVLLTLTTLHNQTTPPGPVCLLYTSERTVGNSVCCSAHEDGFTFPTAAQCATLDVTEDAMVCSALTCMGS